MSQLFTLLATPGVSVTLHQLASGTDSAYPRIHLENVLHDHGTLSPHSVLDGLIGANLLQRIGDQYGISRSGRKVQLLLEAIRGADVGDVCRQLQQIDGTQSYELVREGMTEGFFAELASGSNRFGTLYICSPWINATELAIKHLRYSFIQHQKRTSELPELLVITRPPRNRIETPALLPFRELGARVFFHPKLHSKLYIREPDKNGGIVLAIVGSQNLTRSKYFELGIRIRGDTQLVRQLIRYFFDLTNVSDETT